MNWKVALLAFVVSCSLFASTRDCSIFGVDSPKRCACIRSNGDSLRALECNREITKKEIAKAKIECLRRCYGDDCDKTCSK